ncbi:MAG TPA: copper oxidase [Terriglobia bacterium]|nr:copper oxidase [Terriglobia bacterium]
MSRSRREFFRQGLLGAGLMASTKGWAKQQGQSHAQQPMPMNMGNMPMPKTEPEPKHAQAPPAPSSEGTGHLMVETPDIPPQLSYTLDNGVKVFNLIAEPVKRELVPGKTIDAWGYNGSAPGPTIQIVQGDRVRLIVDNHLPEATSMHWHGFEIPIDMDGVPGVTQDLIPPGGRFVYEFTLHQEGTYFYHSHMAMQEMMGLIGLFIMHPKEPYNPRVDKDFGLILQEWAVLPNNTVPNTLSMEFNWLTINGKSGPATTPLIVKLGERVRIRFVNIGMDHHPMHLHGNTFYVTGTEGGRAPQSTWRPENTVLVGVAQARDIEFDAKYTGDWMLHCHLPHHMMNQMVSMVGPMMEAGHGMRTGMGMEEGMGMMRQGNALSEENGPSLGRAIGIGADHEKATTNMPLSARAEHGMPGMTHQMPNMPGMSQNMQHMPGMNMPMENKNPEMVPGYPQDMFMPMDEMFVKPETYGLRKGWSGGVMGMMTLVRVLPPELYDKVMGLKKEQQNGKPAMPPGMHHPHA